VRQNRRDGDSRSFKKLVHEYQSCTIESPERTSGSSSITAKA
jgi:hypothetical protein